MGSLRLIPVVVLLLIGTAPIRAAAGPSEGGCAPGSEFLPAEVGPAVTAALGRHAAELPAGWTVAGTRAGTDRVSIRLRGPDGTARTLDLVRPGGGGFQASGRWFALGLPPDAAGADRDALVALGHALDASFARSPWKPCSDAPAAAANLPLSYPAWAAVALGTAELLLPPVLVILLGFAWRRRGPSDRRGLPWPFLAALFVAALAVQFRAGGVSPRVWIDTATEQRWVRDCLDTGACPTDGAKTSIEGLRHDASWLQMRTSLEALGLGFEGTQGFLHLLTALGVVAVALAGARLSGPLAGLVAALAQCRWGLWLVKSDAVYNSRTLLALGALTLAMGLRAAETRRSRDLALLALLVAITANVHDAGVLLGTTVVAAAWFHPRRGAAVVAAVGLCAGAALVLAPSMWIGNLRSVLAGLPPARAAGGAPMPLEGLDWIALATAAGVVVTWAVTRRERRDGELLATLAAFLVPGVAACEGGRLVGATEATIRYLAPWLPGMAVGAVVVAERCLAGASGRILGPRVTTVPERPASKPRQVAGFALLALPVLAVAGLATLDRDRLGSDVGRAATGLPAMTLADVRGLAEAFGRRGWDLDRVARDVRTPEAAAFLGALELAGRDHPADATVSTPGGAVVLKLSADDPVLVTPTDPWIQWGAMRACLVDDAAGTADCIDGPAVFRGEIASRRGDGPGRLPGRPGTTEGRLTVVVPARVPAGADVHELHLPAMPGVCPGRVGRATPPAPDPSGSGRAGLLVAGDEPAEVELVLEWDLADPVCARWGYDGTLPFVIEADVGTVTDLKARLAAFEDE